MIKYLSVPFMILLGITGCSRHQPGNPQDLAEIAGCWKGRQIAKFDRPFSELILFSLRSDGSLALSMIYEIGPRSRVWTLDTDVDAREGIVRWGDQEGSLDVDKNTMHVTRVDAGGKSTWLFVRDRSADSLMKQLRANRAGPYAYRMPEDRKDGWQCGDISASDIDKSKIIELIEQIRNGEHEFFYRYGLDGIRWMAAVRHEPAETTDGWRVGHAVLTPDAMYVSAVELL
jgi:hypothetical protein